MVQAGLRGIDTEFDLAFQMAITAVTVILKLWVWLIIGTLPSENCSSTPVMGTTSVGEFCTRQEPFCLLRLLF